MTTKTPKPRPPAPLTLRLDPALTRRVKEYVRRRRAEPVGEAGLPSISSVMRAALVAYLDANERKGGK